MPSLWLLVAVQRVLAASTAQVPGQTLLVEVTVLPVGSGMHPAAPVGSRMPSGPTR